VEPGTYMVRLTVGGQTLTSSVTVLEDIWMRPQ
jgi:PKD repeat protein